MKSTTEGRTKENVHGMTGGNANKQSDGREKKKRKKEEKKKKYHGYDEIDDNSSVHVMCGNKQYVS